MRPAVVLLPLLILALTAHIPRADGNKPQGWGQHDPHSNGDGGQKSNSGVGPVNNPHCPKPGRGPDPHGDGHGPPKNTACGNEQESPSQPGTPSDQGT